MPDDATVNAMPLFNRILARIIEIRNVLPVTPGASKKKNPPCPAETASKFGRKWFFVPHSLVGHCE